ncbi:MAG: TSUP family transporter [Pseudomonadota bacterium]
MLDGVASHLPEGSLWIPLILVFVGSALQVATGVGLGLIAAPAILFVLDGPAAVQAAIILNLTLSALLLPSEASQVSVVRLMAIGRWALIGIPLGGLLLMAVGDTSLKLICGVVVILAVLQLRFFPFPEVAQANRQRWLNRFGGTVSGAMTGALAAPGPVALWALLSTGLDSLSVRATLRAFFVYAYVIALVVSLVLAGTNATTWSTVLVLLPAVLLGIAAGIVGRGLISGDTLRVLLELVLLAMGVAMLLKGVSDAGGF